MKKSRVDLARNSLLEKYHDLVRESRILMNRVWIHPKTTMKSGNENE